MLTFDHAVYAGRDHDELVERFADAGLVADYGGVHSHGTTQMSVVGFSDGSYLELIGPAEGVDPATADFWPDALAADAGPAAWAVLVDDVADAAVAHVRAGVPVGGPHHGGRERDDGRRVEWTVAFVGDDAAREAYPLLMADRTPRRYRVTPTNAHAEGPLAGVAEVVIAVADADAWADRLARLHDFPTPDPVEHGEVPGDLRSVPGQPVTLAEAETDDPAAVRDGLGEGPVTHLLGTADIDAARDAYDLTPAAPWNGRRLAWLVGLEGEVGVIEPPSGGPASAGPER